MSTPFVCSACRQALLRQSGRLLASAQALRKLSTTRPSVQEHQTRYARDAQDAQREPRSSIRRRDDPRPRPSQAQYDRPEQRRGRYSGQSLKPEQLLNQLDYGHGTVETRERRRPSADYGTAKRRTGDDLNHILRRRDGQTTYLAAKRDLNKAKALLEPFVLAVDARENGKAWTALLRMRDELGEWEMRAIHKDRDLKFYARLHQLMRRIDSAYFGRQHKAALCTESLNRGAALSSFLPSPLEFAEVAKALHCLSPPLRTELLWRLGKNLMAARLRKEYAISPELDADVRKQIVLLWHDSLATRLWDEDNAPHLRTNVDKLNWSQLPPPHIIAVSDKDLKSTLIDVLSKIVPIKLRPETSQHFVTDWQSALLLTISLLKGGGLSASAPPGEEPAKPSVVSGADPLIAFFDAILARTTMPTMPFAIGKQMGTAEDPILDYYENLARSYNIQDTPPVRENRARIVLSKRDEIQYLHTTGFGAWSNPQLIPKPSKDGPGEAVELPEAAVANEETEAPTPVPLDRESLLAAGFSAADQKDMDPEVHRQVDTWLKRLGRSIETTNLAAAEACWEEVCAFNNANAGVASLPLYLYEHFMLAFLAMRQPKLAVDTWTMVAKVGLKPTVRTWTVMMRGCARAGDVDTLMSFWQRMRAQGVQPDQHAWSIKVTALMRERQIDDGLAALKAMGQEWIDAIRATPAPAPAKAKAGKHQPQASEILPNLADYPEDVNGVPRPSLVVMNSAVSALANTADTHIPQVLSWGRTFNIDPDLTTYNALLNVAMRHGQAPEALAIFKRMQDRGIQPDSTTFTVILTALFQSDFLTNLPHSDQISRLLQLITTIEEAAPSATMDAKSYALAIDRMLKLHSNPAAAAALLSHMSSSGIEPTPHIYTILMSSYFASSPPDLAAAESLWNRIKNSNRGYGAPVDVIFYDRIVESYAQHHELAGMAPMLYFLERMGKEGKRPSWRALECVARALADRGEWSRLRSLVGDVKELKGTVRLGARGLIGQNEFWNFCMSVGVVADPNMKDLRGRGTSSWRNEGVAEEVV